LLIIVSAHSLASLTFFASDEFFQLKLQSEWVFQQTANRELTGATVLLNDSLTGSLKPSHSITVIYANFREFG
jgi:hypothetical protein